LLVPDATNPGQWKTLINPGEMEDTLIDYCQEHFKEAHGSPYTVPLLSILLSPHSITPYGRQVLDGTADIQNLDVSHHTKTLLRHQKAWPQSHLPRFHDLTYNSMVMGF